MGLSAELVRALGERVGADHGQRGAHCPLRE